MSGIAHSVEDEDKAQSTLGTQSALLSMFNMGMPRSLLFRTGC